MLGLLVGVLLKLDKPVAIQSWREQVMDVALATTARSLCGRPDADPAYADPALRISIISAVLSALDMPSLCYKEESLLRHALDYGQWDALLQSCCDAMTHASDVLRKTFQPIRQQPENQNSPNHSQNDLKRLFKVIFGPTEALKNVRTVDDLVCKIEKRFLQGRFISFLSEVCLFSAMHERIVGNKATVSALLRFIGTFLHCRLSNQEHQSFVFSVLNLLFLLIAQENSACCFLDNAFDCDTKAALGIVDRVVELFSTVFGDMTAQAQPPCLDLQLCLLRVVESLADDSNTKGILGAMIVPTLIKILSTPRFKEVWVDPLHASKQPADGNGLQGEASPPPGSGPIFCQYASVIQSIQMRETFDVILATWDTAMGKLPQRREICMIECSLMLYRILLDLPEGIVKPAQEVRDNICMLFRSIHACIPRDLMLVAESDLILTVCKNLGVEPSTVGVNESGYVIYHTNQVESLIRVNSNTRT